MAAHRGETGTLTVTIADGPTQTPGPVPGSAFRQFDLRARPDAVAAAHEFMRDDLAEPVALHGGPLFTTVLLRLTDEHFLWYHRYHHVVIDGRGLGMAVERAAEVYNALAEGTAPGPSPFGSLDSLLRHEADYRAGAEFAADRGFWIGRLADLPSAPSPSRRSDTRLLPSVRRSAALEVARPARWRRAARAAGWDFRRSWSPPPRCTCGG